LKNNYIVMLYNIILDVTNDPRGNFILILKLAAAI